MEPEQLGIVRKAMFGREQDELTLTLEVQILSGTFTARIKDRNAYEALILLVSDVSRLSGAAVVVTGNWSSGFSVVRGIP